MTAQMTNIVPFHRERLSERDRAYIRGDELAQVKAGTYDLAYVEHKVKPNLHLNNTKLVIWFRIVTPGEFHGIVLPKYYGVQLKKGSEFKVGPKSDFARDYVDIFKVAPARWYRVPMTKFRGIVIEGAVRTVTTGRAKKGKVQRKIPEPLQYSVIDHLIRLSTG